MRFCCIVSDRSSDTLINIISNVVVPGSIICSDEWAAYASLGRNQNFEHRTVCHKYNFINLADGTYTQRVESCINRLKLGIKAMKGLTLEQRKLFLLEFMFKERLSSDKFISYIKLFKC